MNPKLKDGDEVIVGADVEIAFKLEGTKCLMFDISEGESFIKSFFVPPHKEFDDIVKDKINELYGGVC